MLTYEQLKEMANRIKSRRESLGFTQDDFSVVVGLSVSSYTKIENAFQKPALDTLIKIAQHLDLSLDYLVFGTENSNPDEPINTDILNALLKYADNEKLSHASEFLEKISKIKGNSENKQTLDQ